MKINKIQKTEKKKRKFEKKNQKAREKKRKSDSHCKSPRLLINGIFPPRADQGADIEISAKFSGNGFLIYVFAFSRLIFAVLFFYFLLDFSVGFEMTSSLLVLSALRSLPPFLTPLCCV